MYHEIINSYKQDNVYIKNAGAAIPVTAGIIPGRFGLKGIPVLAYHCIDKNIWGVKSLFVSPSAFEEQMKYLKEHGYTAITFNDLWTVKSAKKPVIITFDDGYEDNFTNAYPILKKYHLKATVFLIVGAINKPKYLKLSEIKKMEDTVDFQSHTMTHPHLAKLSLARIQFELSESKKQLVELLNTKINSIAYPYGSYDKRVISVAERYYKYGLTTNFGEFYDDAADEYQIRRLIVSDQTSLKKFAGLLS